MQILGPTDLIASYYTLTGAAPGQHPRFGFAERVAAAAAAGFAAIGFQPADYAMCRAAGLSDGDMQRILADHGIRIAELEFLFDWAHGGERGAAARKLEDEFYRLADVFQSRHLNVGDLGLGGPLDPLPAVAERFAAVCDRAAQHGLQVAIEFLPWTPIPDAATAWAIARTAGHVNGGLLVDAWHYFRGAADPAVLRAIPAERIIAVQLDDADTMVVGDLAEDTCLRRRLPGDGSFDLVGFIRLLDAMGVQTPLSVEILSTDQWALPVHAAARAAFDTTRAVLAEARGHAR
ncbi:MAG: Xylose isomerase domain protein barrel [Deltaproteobacteria bacterium]|jgi:sugar phosphate isomerase/epimerase|nr:Xylose isomerase domain protein barrel [Deltaproteobacteria bacterium]